MFFPYLRGRTLYVFCTYSECNILQRPYLATRLIDYWSTICRISVPYPFQWGAPTFDAGEAFAMMAASFVALVEVCYLDKPMIFLQLCYPRWNCISSSFKLILLTAWCSPPVHLLPFHGMPVQHHALLPSWVVALGGRYRPNSFCLQLVYPKILNDIWASYWLTQLICLCAIPGSWHFAEWLVWNS